MQTTEPLVTIQVLSAVLHHPLLLHQELFLLEVVTEGQDMHQQPATQVALVVLAVAAEGMAEERGRQAHPVKVLPVVLLVQTDLDREEDKVQQEQLVLQERRLPQEGLVY